MHSQLRSILQRLQALINNQNGQDIVEYSLVVALLAFAATAGMKSVASGVRTAFTNISTALSSNIS